MDADGATSKRTQAAQVAHVLARAVRDGEVRSVDARRLLGHERRRLNTNRKPEISTRPRGAQAAITKYAPEPVLKNGSADPLLAGYTLRP